MWCGGKSTCKILNNFIFVASLTHKFLQSIYWGWRSTKTTIMGQTATRYVVGSHQLLKTSCVNTRFWHTPVVPKLGGINMTNCHLTKRGFAFVDIAHIQRLAINFLFDYQLACQCGCVCDACHSH